MFYELKVERLYRKNLPPEKVRNLSKNNSLIQKQKDNITGRQYHRKTTSQEENLTRRQEATSEYKCLIARQPIGKTV